MDNNNVINDRVEKLNELKLLLNKIEDELMVITGELNWDYQKLSEKPYGMATCSINTQHRMPSCSLKSHEEKCSWHYEGYSNKEKTFPEYSGSGSLVTLTPESLHSITKSVSSCTEIEHLRAVPQSSANFDQNFAREEKLAIYDYVIANTQKQIPYTDLWLQPAEKSEKKEKAAWEIAAAERDAKRRRASYRNKVHTNRKTHTEILREVIEAQMEAFKVDNIDEKEKEMSRPHMHNKISSQEAKDCSDKRRHPKSSSHLSREDRNKRENHDSHSKHREHKKTLSGTGSDIKSRSGLHDKHRKWKSYEGRSHSHRSSHTYRR